MLCKVIRKGCVLIDTSQSQDIHRGYILQVTERHGDSLRCHVSNDDYGDT